MPGYPTPDIVTALAPDAASLKAGRGLASPGKWALAAGNETALWGLMQGSGKDPYQVQTLADGSATKCSCPSRKFPCKHALGLLLIAAEQPQKLTSSAPPAWVEEWLASRADKAAKAETKAAQAADGPVKPVDEKAQARRREKREERIAEGLAFLRQWLADLMRQGLADAPITSPAFWENPARRLIDAQAPGLARLVRQAGETARRDASAQAQESGRLRVPDELGRLHLLLTAAGQQESLTPDLRSEVDQLLGWTVPQETVLAGSPALRDQWFAAARTVEEDDRILTAVTWLYGAQSGRFALWLQSAPVQQPVFAPVPLGRFLEGELVFYPGAEPLRVLWKGTFTTVSEAGDDDGKRPAAVMPAERLRDSATETVNKLLDRCARGLAVNPWRTRQPFFLLARMVSDNGQDWLVDETGHGLPVPMNTARRQLMAALSGGRRAVVFGLWDGAEALPLAMEAEDGGWISLTGGQPA